MSDLISRRAAIDAAIQSTMDWDGMFIQDANCRIRDAINELPSAQPERETAKFIRWMECKKTVNYISYTPHCKCSKCGTEFIIDTIKYCYMCGARMER